MSLAQLTGRGVRVAMIDSGVNPAHPHVGGVAGGVAIGAAGESSVFLDYLGHGTAVAGAIREKAPAVELYAVKVFDRALRTSMDRICRAVEWALATGVDIVNLSLGTLNPAHRAAWEELVERAAAAGAVIVAPRDADGRDSLPGCIEGVVPVGLDWECPRESYRCRVSDGRPLFLASGYPRPVPGLPRDRNLSGISFAVANMTGFTALARQACDHPAGLVDSLARDAAR